MNTLSPINQINSNFLAEEKSVNSQIIQEIPLESAFAGVISTDSNFIQSQIINHSPNEASEFYSPIVNQSNLEALNSNQGINPNSQNNFPTENYSSPFGPANYYYPSNDYNWQQITPNQPTLPYPTEWQPQASNNIDYTNQFPNQNP